MIKKVLTACVYVCVYVLVQGNYIYLHQPMPSLIAPSDEDAADELQEKSLG